MGKDEVVIERFLAAVERGAPLGSDVLSEDVVLDATVPNWRFTVHGAPAVRDELVKWYAAPGRFEDLSRSSVPGGELVRFTLHWEEDGVPHAVHQAHVVSVRDGRVVRDEVWCGGRWPASLLAEMAAAASG
jgi:ketosteroid isomerase-like protein